MAPIAERLGDLLKSPVLFASDCVGAPAETAARGLKASGVALFENVRFHPEEEANDPAFAARLAALGDIYVNDAFATAHRAHASTEGIAHYLPSVAGLLMEKEIVTLSALLHQPRRPFVAVIGGAKVSSKLAVLRNLLDRVDHLLIGGGIANTFLEAQGREVGRSLLEVDLIPTATDLLAQPGAEIEHGRSGFLVTSTEECADWIVRLVRNPALAQSIGLAARERVRSRFLLPRFGTRRAGSVRGYRPVSRRPPTATRPTPGDRPTYTPAVWSCGRLPKTSSVTAGVSAWPVVVVLLGASWPERRRHKRC
ncbi:MAG TPA: phosphoglycerate kinase [Chloroflexota bacterium]|nr:phosphoglycerate kinase [Chloroflexota bacterium]